MVSSGADGGAIRARLLLVRPERADRQRQRASVEGRSHIPHKLQTALTPAQEVVAVVVALRNQA